MIYYMGTLCHAHFPSNFERSRICREIQLNSPGNFGLENLGFVTLPEKRKTEKPVYRVPAFSKPPDDSPIEGTLEEIAPITLRRVTSTENRQDYEDFKAY